MVPVHSDVSFSFGPTQWIPAMHELSIAQQLIAITKEHLPDEQATCVLRIKIRLGEFSCVHQDSLRNAFSMLTEGTPLENTGLLIETVPLAVYCPACDEVCDSHHGIQSLRCPKCNGITGDIRRGQELDLEWIELVQDTKHGTTNSRSSNKDLEEK